MTNLSNIKQLQSNYARDVNTEAKIREITKQELFSEQNLRNVQSPLAAIRNWKCTHFKVNYRRYMKGQHLSK